MLKGGYQIINLDGYNISLDEPFDMDNLTKIINSSTKALLISGLVLNEKLIRDFYVAQKDDNTYTNGIYDIIITENTIRITKTAIPESKPTEILDLTGLLPELNIYFYKEGAYSKISRYVSGEVELIIKNFPFDYITGDSIVKNPICGFTNKEVEIDEEMRIIDGFGFMVFENLFVGEDDIIRRL